MDKSRRKVIRAIASGAAWVGAGLAGGLIAGFSGPIGERILNTIYEEKDVEEAEKEALHFLIGESCEIPSIYAGEGNLLGSLSGVKGLSVYLGYSASQFTNYVAKALNPVRNITSDNVNEAFSYDRRRTSIFLGGPSANDITSKLLGYRNIRVRQGGKWVSMAAPDRDNHLTRWGQVYGESGFGVFNGKLEVASRYSSSTGKEVRRPVYRMLDKQTGEILKSSIEHGFLMNEWLTVAKLKDGDAFKVVIGGMHGYSTEAFCRNISRSIDRLREVVGSMEQYQVIVPVNLHHGSDLTGRPCTTGEIDWQYARKHQVVA